MGISVDDSDAIGAPVATAEEYEIRGVFESVLHNNMEQLQWTALSVLLLAFSTSLLATAHEVPDLLSAFLSGDTSSELEQIRETVPEAFGVTADLIEQVCTLPVQILA